MRILHALLGEHGALYPLLTLIENTAAAAGLEQLHAQADCLRSTLGSHADLEDELLRPAIQKYLPPPPVTPDGNPAATDHEVIGEGLSAVIASRDAGHARRLLLETVAKTRKHFHKEETIIFRIAARELTFDDQERLGAEWARRRGVCAASRCE